MCVLLQVQNKDKEAKEKEEKKEEDGAAGRKEAEPAVVPPQGQAPPVPPVAGDQKNQNADLPALPPPVLSRTESVDLQQQVRVMTFYHSLCCFFTPRLTNTYTTFLVFYARLWVCYSTKPRMRVVKESSRICNDSFVNSYLLNYNEKLRVYNEQVC